MSGNKISDAPENKFCSLLYAFEMKEGTEGKLEKAQGGLDYRIVNKTVYSLEG